MVETSVSEQPSWVPSAAEVERARITDFARYASARTGQDVTGGYRELWDWSVRDIDGFWSAVWDYCAVRYQSDGSHGGSGFRRADRLQPVSAYFWSDW
jgi:hypothetical protein